MELARIEAETETHRSVKALTQLHGDVPLPIPNGVVRVQVDPAVASTPVGQKVTLMVTHLLLRMKGIIRAVSVPSRLAEVPIVTASPLTGDSLLEGLKILADSLNHPNSIHHARLETDGPSHLVIQVGAGRADITVAADGWRALTGRYAADARWDDLAPFGAYMASTIAVSQALERLVALHHDVTPPPAPDVAHSLFDHSFGPDARPGPDLPHVTLRDMMVGGAGAGGTAALYTLASLPHLDGHITVVEPKGHKVSGLNRYLMTRATDVYDGAHKLDTMGAHLDRFAPDLTITPIREHWEDRRRNSPLVVATVDTLEGRRAIQQDTADGIILEAGVDGYIFTVLRVGRSGFCIGCKIPPDADIYRAAAIWDMSVDEYRQRLEINAVVSDIDIARLENAQNATPGTFSELVGRGWKESAVPLSCGDARITPQQVGSIPMATTAAGVIIAAEAAKHLTGVGSPLDNWLERDLRYAPHQRHHRHRQSASHCLYH